MADEKKMSVEDILAACRKAGGRADAPSPPAEAASESSSGQADAPESVPESSGSPPAASTAGGQMSVDEILAAARGGKSGTSSKETGSKGAGPAEKGPSTAGGPASQKPGDMSVGDILAAARAGKKAPAEAASSSRKKAPSKAVAGKPTAKPAKPSPKTAPAGEGVPRDTSSILAAARKSTKPGPVSKSEAAAHGAKRGPQRDDKAKPALIVPPMPEKPAAARPAPMAAAEPEKRRTFLAVLFGSSLAIGFTMLTGVFTLWTLGMARYMFPNILTEPPNRFKVGFPANFPPGMVETKFKAQFGVWIVNTLYDGKPEIFALRSVCTHLGCTPNWLEAEQKFKCPCHGSGFYIDGINFEGPAPRPLERYAIRLADDGQLEVDKSSTFQEELGQWRDPASFVPV